MSDERRGGVGEGSVQRDEEKLSKRTNVYEIILDTQSRHLKE